MADSYNPTIVKGDTVTWAMGVCGGTGAAYNLTGVTLTMEIRKSYYPGNEIVKYVKGVTSGTTFNPPDGVTGGIAVTGTGGLIYVLLDRTRLIRGLRDDVTLCPHLFEPHH